ncbi:MAG: nuclear transport factor 2 family protein [Deltaproteobacteria bacterium]|nr:nuclear transport factor 2 family protein [Deltaproteobacteria bacterium]
MADSTRPRLDPETAEQLASAYLARHGATDLEGVVALFAEDASLEDPVGSRILRGRDAIRAFYRETHARNGPLVFERIGEVLVGGEELAFHVKARLASVTGAGGMDVIYVLRVEDAGRICSLRAWY